MREKPGKKTLINNALYTVNHSVVMNTITNHGKQGYFSQKRQKDLNNIKGYMYVQAVPVDFLTS